MNKLSNYEIRVITTESEPGEGFVPHQARTRCSRNFNTLSPKEVGKMKKVICGLVLFCLLAFFSVSMAQELPRIFGGRISEVDSRTGTVVVKGGEKDMAFSISDETNIKTEYGVAVPFNELKKDMEVTVEYLIKEGNLIQPLSIKVSGISGGSVKYKRKNRRKNRIFRNTFSKYSPRSSALPYSISKRNWSRTLQGAI